MNQPYNDDEMETVHLYIYEEPIKQPSDGMGGRLLARLIQVIAFGMLAVFCLIPYTPVYATRMMVVPAHFLPVQVFSAYSPIVPTGKTEHPATQAHGVLTVYNGLSFAQVVPQGFILTSKEGQEVATDESVTIPPGNAPTYGSATVSAHAVVAGMQGNIPSDAIQAMEGSSITIMNLSAFEGGQDAYTEQSITLDDTARALENAREQLTAKIPVGLLAGPCAEKTAQDGNTLTLTWACQYVTYTVPANLQILSARVEGKHVLLQVNIVVLPK